MYASSAVPISLIHESLAAHAQWLGIPYLSKFYWCKKVFHRIAELRNLGLAVDRKIALVLQQMGRKNIRYKAYLNRHIHK